MAYYSSRLQQVIRNISLGQYNTVFFKKDGTNHQSSVLGGILTIIITFAFFVITVIMLVDTFRVHYFHE